MQKFEVKLMNNLNQFTVKKIESQQKNNFIWLTTDNKNVLQIKLLTFPGEEQHYSLWWIRFQLYPRVKFFTLRQQRVKIFRTRSRFRNIEKNEEKICTSPKEQISCGGFGDNITIRSIIENCWCGM